MMVPPMSRDLETMSLAELVELKEQISKTLVRRFQRQVTLVFTDIVGSTVYFERLGDAAGKALVERHHRLLAEAMKGTDGRVVDTAGDGAFCVFSEVEDAARALIRFQEAIDASNAQLPVKERLSVRAGLHWGPALMDGPGVSGDAVNYAARVSSVADGGQIFVSKAVVDRLPPTLKLRCVAQGERSLKGVSESVKLYSLMWLDPRNFPGMVRNCATDESFSVPLQTKVRFGRLAEFQDGVANEVVLSHPDDEMRRRVSRWHFELHRTPDGFRFHQLAATASRVDGVEVSKGETVPLRPDSQVEVAGVLELRFTPMTALQGDETQLPED